MGVKHTLRLIVIVLEIISKVHFHIKFHLVVNAKGFVNAKSAQMDCGRLTKLYKRVCTDNPNWNDTIGTLKI